MKTTIEFSDALLHATRRAAAERRATSRSIFELALRQYLEGQDETSPGLRRHTFRGRGLQAGLSEGDWAAIRERAYEFTTPGSQRSAATTESASCARRIATSAA